MFFYILAVGLVGLCSSSFAAPCDSNQLDFADNWGTGGRGFFKINFPIAVDNGWTASATFSRPITAMRLWDAVNPKCSGSTCTFNNQAWNAKQGKGAFLKLEFSFDFPNGATPQLVSLTINGASVCGGSGPNPGPNPSPPSPTTVAPPSPTSALPPGPMPPTNPPSSGQRGVYVPMPKKVVGLYLAIADESVSGFTTNDNWTPQLFDYQQSGSNLLFFSFVNPLTMVVPKSFANFARTRGTNAAGAIPKNTMIVFAIGGYGYSLGQYNPWPWLSSKAAAESMAEQVAKWPSLYGCDGIDLDIETGAGDVPNSGVNMVFFVRKLRALVPNIYIGQPTFGYPQVVAENDVINESWDAQGNSKNLADTIGLMVYEGTQSLDWVKSYVSGADQGAGFPIKCRAPANTILLGAKGSASSGDIMTMANASVSKGYRGIMVWYASVKNGFGYEASWDTSKYTDSQQGFKNAMNSFNPAG